MGSWPCSPSAGHSGSVTYTKGRAGPLQCPRGVCRHCSAPAKPPHKPARAGVTSIITSCTQGECKLEVCQFYWYSLSASFNVFSFPGLCTSSFHIPMTPAALTEQSLSLRSDRTAVPGDEHNGYFHDVFTKVRDCKILNFLNPGTPLHSFAPIFRSVCSTGAFI